PIWPADVLKVNGAPLDPDQAAQTALRYRPDLNLLRAVANDAEHGGELANAILSAVNPLLGVVGSSHPLTPALAAIKKNPTKAEATAHRQIVGLLATRERQADAEVRAAVATVRGSRAAVAAKAAETRNLQSKIAELEKRAAAGVAGAEAELAVARLDLLTLK